MYGKDQKHLKRWKSIESDYRSGVVKSRRTKEAVWKGPEVLKKMYGK